MDEDFQVLKNIDDFCLFAKTLPELEKQIDKLAELCQKINLKLSPSKFTLSTAVKFGGTIISAETTGSWPSQRWKDLQAQKIYNNSVE